MKPEPALGFLGRRQAPRSPACPGGSGCRPGKRGLDAGYVGDYPAFGIHPGIPVLEEAVELAGLVATRLEPHRLRRFGGHSVLVPGDVPGDRDHELVVDPGQLQDARTWRAEALRDAADRPPVVAGVEDVRRFDHREFRLAQPP